MSSSGTLDVREFESSIEAIVASGDNEAILDLLYLLDDTCEYDEAMWSVIHTAEIVPDSEYVDGVVLRLPRVAQAAPGWAIMVVARVLKSQACRPLFEAAVLSASGAARGAGIRILERILSEKPDLVADASRILDVLRSPG